MEGRLVAVAVMALLSACVASPTPSLTSSRPTPSPPTPTPTAIPANPELECHQSTDSGAVDCRAALALAISALPPGDLPRRAVFTYGTNCGSTSCGGHSPEDFGVDFGLVTFSYADDDTHREYVYVVADDDGRLQLAGAISSSPPPVLSVPTPVASPR